MGSNFCHLDNQQTSSLIVPNMSNEISAQSDNVDDDYDNPKRIHLSSNFLSTKVDASNNLMQEGSMTVLKKGVSLQKCITQQHNKIEMETKKTIQKQTIIKRLPSIKINYGDFVCYSKKNIDEKYRILERLGAGAFGEVFKAESTLTGQVRAIKMFKKKDMQKHKEEVQILKQCDHPNIIQLYEVIQYKNSYHVVMEYCQGGSINNLIKKKKFVYLENEARSILEQILNALTYLHGKGIIHRDIKLENVVFMEPAAGHDITSNLKLIDFGNAERVKFKVNKSHIIGGTTMYMPPESFSGWYSYTFDIWSCGVLLCILLTGHCPYKRSNKDEIIQAIKNTEVDFKDPRWQKISEQAKQLVKLMLNKDFMKRPSAQQCLKNKWFQVPVDRSHHRKASQKFSKQLSKYYAINNFVSLVQSYLSFLKISKSQKNDIRQLFQAIDVRKQGKLSKNDIIKVYSQSIEPAQEQELEKWIQANDKNKSGYIDYSEFLTAMSDRHKLFMREYLENAFDYFDFDSSGYIQMNELISCLKNAKTAEIEDLISDIDYDHDKKISKEEFIQYFDKIQKQMIQD